MDPDLKLALDAWRKEVVERDRLQQLCYELLGQLQVYRMKEDLEETTKSWKRVRKGDRCED